MSAEAKELRTRTKNKSEKKRDPNLDNEAVRKYRDIVHLQANHIQREDIAYVVENSARSLALWEATLLEHMGHGWNPRDVLTMLKNYRAMLGNGHR